MTTSCAVPPKVATTYYRNVVAKTGARAVKDSMRFFMVPGMGHGPGTNGVENINFDALGVIEQWKQTGKAPDQLADEIQRVGHAGQGGIIVKEDGCRRRRRWFARGRAPT